MSQIVVLDTNVLLADPNSMLSFPRAEVVIPETVLGELDKLKTARVDPDLRFRGREVSRMLFELSEEGSLVDGVDLPDGGRLRVAPLDTDTDLPEGLVDAQRRRPHPRDRLPGMPGRRRRLRCPARHQRPQHAAQGADARHVRSQRYGEGVEGGFAKRYIIRPFQRYKVPLGSSPSRSPCSRPSRHRRS